MKKIVIFSLVFVFISSNITYAGFGDWSKYSQNMSYVLTSFSVIDVIQTRRFIEGDTNNGKFIREGNPFIPENRYLYIPATIGYNYLGYKLADRYLTQKQRKVTLTAITILEAYVVYRNSQNLKEVYDNTSTIPILNIAF